jgi:hypothetical protein
VAVRTEQQIEGTHHEWATHFHFSCREDAGDGPVTLSRRGYIEDLRILSPIVRMQSVVQMSAAVAYRSPPSTVTTRTLPIEQTKEAMAPIGPTNESGQIREQGSPVRKNDSQDPGVPKPA